MRFLFAVLGLAILSATPAVAQTISANTSLARDERSVGYVNVEDLKAVVVASGHTIMTVGKFGVTSVRAKTADGLIFDLIGTACGDGDKTECQGISMQVRYDIDERLTYEKLNRANMRYWAASVWIDYEAETLAITRYVILDDGVTMANVKSNLLNLLAVNENIQKEIW